MNPSCEEITEACNPIQVKALPSGRHPSLNGKASSYEAHHANGTQHSNGNAPNQDVPIAIIGVSTRFPGGADSPEALWKMISKGKSAWSEIPADRFALDAFYHPDPDRNGTMNVRGGHFIDEDIACFDAPFFGISPNEAKAMDPQQRLQLESAYEALENAGIPLEKAAGSKTSVYVGVFNKDYADIMCRDPETGPLYQATGNGQSILSNRISYFFDLKGPSITIDTACSSSLVGLHLACQGLRAGEADQAIVGGTNLIFSPDIMVAMSLLGFLSPDGRSYAFDHRAQGYARGEGVATLVLKPLDKALRDGDNVQAVIRGTGVNSDGRTAGITLPSGDAQEALIREVYKNAGLDPINTGYFEAHGTGTQAGDPMEAGAIHRVFTADRERSHPLYVGSVKTNIGHLEGASGLAGVVKAILCLNKGFIPPSINFEKPNERLDLEKWNLKVPTELTPWPKTVLRRASINSFGYGGTNAHVVLDELRSYLSAVEGSLPTEILRSLPAGPPPSSSLIDDRRQLFVMTAQDEVAGSQTIDRLVRYLKETKPEDQVTFLRDLAFTLSERRSLLPYRLRVTASSTSELVEVLETGKLQFRQSLRSPRVGFVFTGQGAQWAQMGLELYAQYPVFANSLRRADQALSLLGSSWSVIKELSRDAASSAINEPQFSQPLCTAIQIALVDLLKSWQVFPTAVNGHSSGEIAAAYAASALSLESAMLAAYYRGLLSSELTAQSDVPGGMAAVGLSPDDAEPYLGQITTGKLVVACYNSPSNITVSGDAAAIGELEAILQGKGIFFRRLKIAVAYHSHHMQQIAAQYRALLEDLSTQDSAASEVQFYSSVTGHLSSTSELGGEYWVRNMVSPVKFSSSLRNMCLGLKADGKRLVRGSRLNVQMLVEIGPHSALAGPIKQLLNDSSAGSGLNGAKISYSSCLVRNENAVTAVLKAAGDLFSNGYPVSLAKVNDPSGVTNPQILADLPPYSWNHSTRYWHESRISRNYRLRNSPRRDLIGAPVPNFNPVEPQWRGFLRVSEIPWIKEHQVQGQIVYPAAGMILMAIEAMRQISPTTEATNFELRDVQIGKALMISETIDDLETMFTMRPWNTSSTESSGHWYEFRLFSVTENESWSEHCRGCICAVTSVTSGELGASEELNFRIKNIQDRVALHKERCVSTIGVRRMYEDLENVGLYYGASFQNLVDLRSAEKDHLAFAHIAVPDTAKVMPQHFEYPHLLHPATLDSALQTIFPALTAGGKELTSPLVPTFIQRMIIANHPPAEPGQVLTVFSSATWKGFRHADAQITVTAKDSEDTGALIEIHGLRCSSIAHMVSADKPSDHRKLCFNMVWDDDLDLLRPADVTKVFPPNPHCSDLSAQVAIMETAAFLYIKKALATLTPEDVPKMMPHHQLFYASMQDIYRRAGQGLYPHHSAFWESCSESKKAAIAEAVASTGAEGRMVCRMGENLARILRQEVDPLSLMLEDDLLYDLYRTALGTDRCYEQMSQIVKKLAHKRPDIQVLEIGAGTGGATLPILETLGGQGEKYPRFTHYDFTDISTGFFEKAQEKFKAWAPFVSYRRLDIEQNLDNQGFGIGQYDLIIAANVLHATRTMKSTMQNVRRLLKPGGKLILMEVTHLLLRGSVIFGNLPGWWLGADEGRTRGPTITEDAWDTLLRDTGFSGLDICLRDFPDEADYMYSVMVTTAEDDAPSQYPPCVIVDSFADQTVATSQLAKGLENMTGVYPEIYPLNALPTCLGGRVCVCLDEISKGFMHELDAPTFERVKAAISSSKGVLWAVRNNTTNNDMPDTSLISGLARSVRSEDQTKRFITLDLDDEHPLSPDDIGSTILRLFKETFGAGDEGVKADWEFKERANRLMIPRVIEDVTLNKLIAQETQDPIPELQSFEQPGRSLKLEIGIPGLLDTLRFANDNSILAPIGDDEVDIRVAASGVNFRDIMVAMGQLVDNFLGCECSGVITQVGRNVTRLKPGDRVCTWTLGSYSTYVRNPEKLVQAIPDDMSFEVAASLPIVYCTAYFAIVDTARLQGGESILVHAAAGGVGQAAIMLAQMIGAEIYVTVGTLEKRKFLRETYGIPDDHIFSSRDTSFAAGVLRMTNGKGVDVVLNSLAGELLRETWHCIAMFGRFIEIGKRDIEINTKLEMSPFIRNVTFASVDLTVIFRHRKPLGAAAMSKVMELLRQRKVSHIQPITTYPISRIEEAFRFMQAGKHLGKLIITADPGDLVKVLPQPKNLLRFRDDGSYLMVGGLGGLGRATSWWMVENGAKNLIFVSRSGTAKAEAATLVDRLGKVGVNVVVLKCDVSDYDQLSAAVGNALQAMPPIRGIIHGGMVLNDSIFEAMSFEQFQDALRPKLTGTKNLHTLTTKMDLDFFIMLSSAAGIVGNSSQGNYAAAGAFQDAFAHYRTAKGLPAVTLDLGGIESVGFLAENQGYVANLQRWGYLTITEAEFLSMLKHAILTPHRSQTACQVITGLGTQGMAETAGKTDSDEVPFWFHDAKFSHLLRMGRNQVNEVDAEGGARMTDAIPAAETFNDVVHVICDAIIAKMAKMLTVPAETIDPSQSMAAYGVDSLVAVELRNWLFREAKADVAVFEVLGKSSLMNLANDIALKSKLLPAALRSKGVQEG